MGVDDVVDMLVEGLMDHFPGARPAAVDTGTGRDARNRRIAEAEMQAVLAADPRMWPTGRREAAGELPEATTWVTALRGRTGEEGEAGCHWNGSGRPLNPVAYSIVPASAILSKPCGSGAAKSQVPTK